MDKVFKVEVYDSYDSRGIGAYITSGEPVTVDGEPWVRYGQSIMVRMTHEWCATEAEAVRAAVPMVAMRAAIIDEQIRRMAEGRLW